MDYLLVGSSSWLQLEYEVVICDTSGVFSKKNTDDQSISINNTDDSIKKTILMVVSKKQY